MVQDGKLPTRSTCAALLGRYGFSGITASQACGAMRLGALVRANRDFYQIPKGTLGIVAKRYDWAGWLVLWEKNPQDIPADMFSDDEVPQFLDVLVPWGTP